MLRVSDRGLLLLSIAVAVSMIVVASLYAMNTISAARSANASVESTVATWTPGYASSPRDSVSAPSTTGSAPTNASTNPAQSPVLTFDFDLASAPRIPAGLTTGQYLLRYYNALDKGRVKDAYKMVRTSDRGGLKGFKKRLADGYDSAAFAIVATVPVDPSTTRMFVAQTTATNGVWTVIWDFVKTARGTALVSLTYTRVTQFACH